MSLEFPEREAKMLKACDGLIKKQPLSFALGTADDGVLLLLRPQKKDRTGDLVRTAFKKTRRALKVKGKLMTWGGVNWENGKVVLNGEKAFPAGAKKKIREFAVQHKLKHFIKCVCKTSEGEVEDATESLTEASAAEAAALAALEQSAPTAVQSEEELEAIVDELILEECRELACDGSVILDQLIGEVPEEILHHGLQSRIEQFMDCGLPEEMLPASLEQYVSQGRDLVSRLAREDDQTLQRQMRLIESLVQRAEALLDDMQTLLTPAQQALWNTAQKSTHSLQQQLVNLKRYLKTSETIRLANIGKGTALDEEFAFINELQKSLLRVHTAPQAKMLSTAVSGLEDAFAECTEVSKSEAYDIVVKAVQEDLDPDFSIDACVRDVDAFMKSLQ
ncbi:MAG: hypothetical protein AAFV53_31710 [Myxococcota bacterium]